MEISVFGAAPCGSLLLAGCGGISASRTVSPLDFLLPGIMRNDPPQTNAPVVAIMVMESSLEVASVR